MLLQHLFVLTLVAGCLLYLGRGVYRSLGSRKSQFGKCCATGCEQPGGTRRQKQGGSGERLVFLPAESLRRRRH